jgi:hypothetical protein
VTRLRRCRVRDATGCARLPAGDRGGRSQHRDGAGASTGLIIGAEVSPVRSAARGRCQPAIGKTHARRGGGPDLGGDTGPRSVRCPWRTPGGRHACSVTRIVESARLRPQASPPIVGRVVAATAG